MPRVLVLHREYGCDTGCCGHVVQVDGIEVDLRDGFKFDFMHPNGRTAREYAEDLVRGAGCDPADLDWDNCVVRED